MRLRVALLTASLLPGCYLAHGLEDVPGPPPPFDAGRPDAGPVPPPPDAGVRDGEHWTLERRDAQLRIEHELGCTQYEGGRIALTVTTPIETICEHAAPVDTEVRDDGTVVVTAHVWVRHGGAEPCDGVSAIAVRKLLLPAHEGTFRAESDDGASRVAIGVGAIDDLPCTFAGDRDAECLLDCECQAGLVCIPQLGDFVECHGGRCGDPCNPTSSLQPIYGEHLECERSERCLPGPASGSYGCQRIDGPGCDPSGATCGPGLVCPPTSAPSECDWDVRLSAMSRHPCRATRDCDPGLLCVEHADGARRCDVPCFSNEMRCPDMHECSGAPWVCEWIGE